MDVNLQMLFQHYRDYPVQNYGTSHLTALPMYYQKTSNGNMKRCIQRELTTW